MSLSYIDLLLSSLTEEAGNTEGPVLSEANRQLTCKLCMVNMSSARMSTSRTRDAGEEHNRLLVRCDSDVFAEISRSSTI